jgi:hypothetical protein
MPGDPKIALSGERSAVVTGAAKGVAKPFGPVTRRSSVAEARD